jgi:CRISPR-associated protein Cas2
VNFLVVYDVETTTREGQRRLRQVARACEGYGQRVQYSVFEVVCDRTSMARLVVHLEEIIRISPLARDGFARVVLLGPRREIPHEDAWVL